MESCCGRRAYTFFSLDTYQLCGCWVVVIDIWESFIGGLPFTRVLLAQEWKTDEAQQCCMPTSVIIDLQAIILDEYAHAGRGTCLVS
jgi:hypothetical protein